MPLLSRRKPWAPEPSMPHTALPGRWRATSASEVEPLATRPAAALERMISTCANAGCKSGWLHVWRSRSRPIFEEGWTCSAECTQVVLRNAVAREMNGLGPGSQSHRHRIPLGLLLVEQGRISPAQLRQALEAQRAAGQGRLGSWLIRQHALDEEVLTRALAQQRGCPVIPLQSHDPALVASAMPRLFLEAFGVLPLRVAAQKVLYLGFEEALDPVLAFAVERMLGLRVESGIVAESAFRPAHSRMLEAQFAPVELIEAVSQSAAAYALARAIERAQPVRSRLVRVHGCLWLRMDLRKSLDRLPDRSLVSDVICAIGDI